MRRGMLSKQAFRWIVAAGIVLLLVSLVLLAYAVMPGGEPLRVQATLAPTLFTVPTGMP